MFLSRQAVLEKRPTRRWSRNGPGLATTRRAAGHGQDNLSKERGSLTLCEVASIVAPFYLVRMLQRTLPAGFIAPCLPTKTDKLPSGSQWLHEIKHDGFRIIARKDGPRVRL